MRICNAVSNVERSGILREDNELLTGLRLEPGPG